MYFHTRTIKQKTDDSTLFGGIYNPFFGWAKFFG